MMPDDTAANSAYDCMMSRVVSGNPADDCALDAASRVCRLSTS